jgi:hypothetical protein
MAYFSPEHRMTVRYGSTLAENIVRKELGWDTRNVYDVKTLQEFDAEEPKDGVFAQLIRVEQSVRCPEHYYRVCLQDREILDFLRANPAVDLLSLITFIMTHELLHIHRFTTGRADFFGDSREEEVLVDALTRVFLAKNPVTGLPRVLSLLDKIMAAPLYNDHIVQDAGRSLNAHL